MDINVPLSPQTEAKLREQAEAAGMDVTRFIVEALEEKLAVADTTSGGNGHSRPAPQQRIAELRAWVASRPRLPYEANDSRESIYEGRNE